MMVPHGALLDSEHNVCHGSTALMCKNHLLVPPHFLA